MFEKVKKALRITRYELEDDIKLAISAALLELERVGVDIKSENELITTAVILYCWYYFDFRNKGENYYTAFKALRNSLSVSSAYIGGDGT